MGVKGFPTLKIVRPGKKTGKPVVDDYQGPRTATGIVEAVVDKMNNHVKRVTDKDMAGFLGEKNESAKALLFTEKGSTSALLKGIAIDFLDVVEVAQVRSKEAESVAMFGVTSFPTLILLPGGEKEGIVVEGEMKKAAIVEFLSQAGSLTPAPRPSLGRRRSPRRRRSRSPPRRPRSRSPRRPPRRPRPSPPLPRPSSSPPSASTPRPGPASWPSCRRSAGADALLASLAELVHRNAVAGRPTVPDVRRAGCEPRVCGAEGGAWD